MEKVLDNLNQHQIFRVLLTSSLCPAGYDRVLDYVKEKWTFKALLSETVFSFQRDLMELACAVIPTESVP